ncbi:MAG TPA: type II toxin-antitoxin system VapC family toxin [Bryobacteraceae bacterium]|jgi:ribonuclease VapC|nr:type II toxin-antitoxin system VapC family toxin [Bryobacteraceae bacterium]
MVVDTSALMAILLREPEEADFLRALERAEFRRMSVGTLLEAHVVSVGKRGSEGLITLEHFFQEARLEFVPITLEQADVARSAFSRFGRGRHRAGLNFGDCFSYALAKVTGEPLLCKGDDFVHTDLPLVEL